MVYRVAVNGFGRIGRNYLRAALERGLLGDGGIELVAVNDLWPAATLAHLLEHDSTFGPLRVGLTETLTHSANVAEELVDASANAGLVVVGTRGHGGFAGLLPGSVSLSVAQHAHCSVAIVRID